jgi:hypothetical protein
MALTLNSIRDRYVAIFAKAGWGSSAECFDEDIQHMSSEMLLGLAEVYWDLAKWKQSYVTGAHAVNPVTPDGAGILENPLPDGTEVTELPTGQNQSILGPIAA